MAGVVQDKTPLVESPYLRSLLVCAFPMPSCIHGPHNDSTRQLGIYHGAVDLIAPFFPLRIQYTSIETTADQTTHTGRRSSRHHRRHIPLPPRYTKNPSAILIRLPRRRRLPWRLRRRRFRNRWLRSGRRPLLRHLRRHKAQLLLLTTYFHTTGWCAHGSGESR